MLVDSFLAILVYTEDDLLGDKALKSGAAGPPESFGFCRMVNLICGFLCF